MKSSSDKIETLKVKAALVSYFRFQKEHSIVCTEFNYGAVDVFSISLDGQEVYEVEVKVSLSDLKREPMKVKHKIPEVQTCFKPCKYFYLAVPEYLKEQALEICKKNFPNAGLYILRDGHYSGSYGASGVDTIIRAKPITIPNLHKYQDLQDRAIRGMANNLAKLYSDLVEAKKQLTPLKLV